MWTNDPVADAERYFSEQDRQLEKLPRCSECDEVIQTDEYYEFNDECICPDCLDSNHRKWVEDYYE